MAFRTNLMADPVFASDGITYERSAIEQWMSSHDVSPITNEPFEHKILTPNVMARKMIASWCEQNGVPVPTAPKREATPVPVVPVAPLLQKPQVTCAVHPKEQLRVFCRSCRRGVCVLCAVDVKLCKAHATEAFDTLIAELKADREEWARAREECTRGAELLCAAIQADGDAKVQAICGQVAALQEQVRAAADERAAVLGAIVQKREEREELVAAAAASPEVAVKDSAAAAVVESALDRAKAAVPPASAAEFRAAQAPAAAVGQLLLAPAVVDPEDAAAIAAAAAAAAEAAAVAAMGALAGSALLRRVTDANKVAQFAALLRPRLAGRGYRLLYTWSRDGRSNASFHQRCDNQVRGELYKGFRVLSCDGVRAGAYAGHRALDDRAHVRRLRQRAVDYSWLDQRCRVLFVPGGESAQRCARVL
jgi:hypothetical protein